MVGAGRFADDEYQQRRPVRGSLRQWARIESDR